jgi:hypothetical protein
VFVDLIRRLPETSRIFAPPVMRGPNEVVTRFIP